MEAIQHCYIIHTVESILAVKEVVIIDDVKGR